MTEYNTRPRRLPLPGKVVYGADPAAIPGAKVASAVDVSPLLLKATVAAGASYFLASNFVSRTTALTIASAAFLYVYQYQQIRLPRLTGKLPRYPDSYEQVPGSASSH